LPLVVVLRAVAFVVVVIAAAVPRRADGIEAVAIAGVRTSLRIAVAEAILRRRRPVRLVAGNRPAIAVRRWRRIAIRIPRVARVPIETVVVPVDEPAPVHVAVLAAADV